MKKMKKVFALCICYLCISMACFSQMETKWLHEGIWTEKDNGISVFKWSFNSNGCFNQISFWNNPIEAGGTFNNGKYYFDDKTNMLYINYEKYALVRNDSMEVNKSNKKLEWKIKSISEDSRWWANNEQIVPPSAMLPSTARLALTPALMTSVSCSGTSIFIRTIGMRLVCLDDHLHEFVPDDVLIREINKFDTFEVF